MPFNWGWIEPKLIIPALIALISSGVFPFPLHKYKVRREREEKLFDTRKEEYQQYFKVMENAARLSGQEYGEFMGKTLPEASLRLYQKNSSPDSVVNYQKVMHEFTKGVQDGFQKAMHELVGLEKGDRKRGQIYLCTLCIATDLKINLSLFPLADRICRLRGQPRS